MKTALERIHQKIDNILTDIINDHKQKRQTTKSAGNVKLEEEDLVDVLLNLQECAVLDFPPTIEEIKAVILVCSIYKLAAVLTLKSYPIDMILSFSLNLRSQCYMQKL